MQRLSPYTENCTKIYPIANLFKNMSKNEWILQLQNSESNFYILAKDEVKQLFLKTGNFIPEYASFDELYALSVQDTIRQFLKNLTRKKNWLLSICSDNNLIFKKIKERLTNNIRNLFDSKRRTNILTLETTLKYIHNESQTFYCDIDTNTDDILALIKTQPKIFKKYLKKIYYDLDYDDFNYLLNLSKYTAIDILGFDPKEYKYSIKKNKLTNQLYLDFSGIK